MTLLNERRAFLFLLDRRCYVVLAADGQVVETAEQLPRQDRLGLGSFLVGLGKDHYDPALRPGGSV